MRLAARAFQAGYRLHSFDTIGSTNAEGLARAVGGDPGRLWLTATVQTAGRGRQGRDWSSPAGNLHASLLLVGAAPERVAPQIAIVAGLALFDAVVEVAGRQGGLAIKWPNDLLADGAKLAGILVEGTRTRSGQPAAVIGFGVNCSHHPDGLPYLATDLAALAGYQVTAAALLEALSGMMLDTLAVWEGGRGFATIRRQWLDRALPLGTAMSVRGGEARLSGEFGGLDPEGRLLLRTEGGTTTVEAGDVLLDDTRPHAADLVD